MPKPPRRTVFGLIEYAKPARGPTIGKVRRPESRHAEPVGTAAGEDIRAGEIVGGRIGRGQRDRSHGGRIPVDRNVVAQAQVQGQLGRDLPVVLEVKAVILIANVGVLHRRGGGARRIRQAQQEAGEASFPSCPSPPGWRFRCARTRRCRWSRPSRGHRSSSAACPSPF